MNSTCGSTSRSHSSCEGRASCRPCSCRAQRRWQQMVSSRSLGFYRAEVVKQQKHSLEYISNTYPGGSGSPLGTPDGALVGSHLEGHNTVLLLQADSAGDSGGGSAGGSSGGSKRGGISGSGVGRAVSVMSMAEALQLVPGSQSQAPTAAVAPSGSGGGARSQGQGQQSSRDAVVAIATLICSLVCEETVFRTIVAHGSVSGSQSPRHNVQPAAVSDSSSHATSSLVTTPGAGDVLCWSVNQHLTKSPRLSSSRHVCCSPIEDTGFKRAGAPAAHLVLYYIYICICARDCLAAMCTSWHQAIQVSLQYLAAQDIVILCACGKAVRNLVIEQLSAGDMYQARRWLLAAVQQAASCNDLEPYAISYSREFERSSKLARWLLSTAAIPPETLNQDSTQYLAIPNLPTHICELLVSAGVNFSYDQLVSAARSRVEGVQNWVVACQQLGVPMDVPASAVAVCCYHIQGILDGSHLYFVTADNIVDHLHLAINTLGRNNYKTTALRWLLDWPSFSLRPRLRWQLAAVDAQQLLESVVYMATVRRVQFGMNGSNDSIMSWFQDMIDRSYVATMGPIVPGLPF